MESKNIDDRIDMKKTRGIVVTGLSGGSGKSIVSVGLTAALRRRGARVVPFKKGPDYIDAGWLQQAAGQSCYNLDPFFCEKEIVQNSFCSHSHGADYAIVEGNRGIYDGVNVEGGFSTADLAVDLKLPVILVVNCTKTTRTIAALVLGCKLFDSRIDIRGVVLNQIATGRQRALVVEAVEKYTGIPVVGAIPRTRREVFPMRHLGMVPHQEYTDSDGALEFLADMAEEHLDIERIITLMSEVDSVAPTPPVVGTERLRVGVLRDPAFQFYYAENLQALEAGGAELVFINAMTANKLPEDLDGLYIGGGFPETNAASLAANDAFLSSLRQAIDGGLPVYAECGGLIYLGRSIVVAGEKYKFAGVFPVDFTMSRKPQAHGYSIFKVEGENPFYPVGSEVKGHEFRYSVVENWQEESSTLPLKMLRGTGFSNGRDGLNYKNVLALYTHVHADGTPLWVQGFLSRCCTLKHG